MVTSLPLGAVPSWLSRDGCRLYISAPAADGGTATDVFLAEKKPPAYIIENIYVRCLSRPPSDVEMKKLVAAVEANPNKQQALEDVFWAIMNSREFMFNH